MTKVRPSQIAGAEAASGQVLMWNGYEWGPSAQTEDSTKVAKALYSAKGALLLGSSATVQTALLIGANNTVLTADSTATTGAKWAAPIDATRIPYSLFDAKGDLIVGLGDNLGGRLPTGELDQVLSPDPTTNTGLKWRTLAAPIASDVVFTPFGTLEATNVQAALEELSVEGGSGGGGGGGGGGGHAIQDEGLALEQRAGLNFVGAGVVVSDDPAGGRTVVSISGSEATILPARTTAVLQTAVLAQNVDETGMVELAPGFRLLRIATNRAARVRLFDSEAGQVADAARPVGEDPAIGVGVLLDFVTVQGALNVPLSPLVDGYVAAGSSAAWTVTNLGAAGAVTVTLTYVRTE